MSYDSNLSAAKHSFLKLMMTENPDKFEIANTVDALNKAWDELTDALVRQRAERDRQILSLIDQLAEAKKR